MQARAPCSRGPPIGAARAARAPAPPARASRAMRAAGAGAAAGAPTRVLFVCLGNICRSPSAEAVFRSVVERAGAADRFEVDSCGTGGGSANWFRPGGFSYHEGEAADARMAAAAAKRGVRLTSRSRPLTPSDLESFDHIIAMDAANCAAIEAAAEHWLGPAEARAALSKVSRMTQFLPDSSAFRGKYDSVPDPYYGGAGGFDLVLDLLDDACAGLLTAIDAGGGD